MKFVGPLREYEENDLRESRNWLETYGKLVQECINSPTIPLAGLDRSFLELRSDADEERVNWCMEYRIEAFLEQGLPLEQLLDFDTLIEDVRPERTHAVEKIRAWIASQYDLLWRDAIQAIPGSISYSSMPALDGFIRTCATGSFALVHGQGKCPSCNKLVEDTRENYMDNGLFTCPYCSAILQNSRNVNLEFEDGIHAMTTENVDEIAVFEALGRGRDDDRRFNVFGPWSDWREGKLRIYAAIIDGTIEGYSTWNDLAGDPVLRIVWVSADHRRQHWASKLIATEGEASDSFGIESPNQLCIAVIKSLGYHEKTWLAPGG